jgi:hypothetical protein
VMTCDHSYDRRCHTSYTTTYEAQQVSMISVHINVFSNDL